MERRKAIETGIFGRLLSNVLPLLQQTLDIFKITVILQVLRLLLSCPAAKCAAAALLPFLLDYTRKQEVRKYEEEVSERTSQCEQIAGRLRRREENSEILFFVDFRCH